MKIDLDTIAFDDLLNVKMCDLPIAITGTWLEECVANLYNELNQKSIVFRPKCYLADEWLTPDLEPIIGIPFYLAHPMLIKLEKKMMLEAEGESKQWCMKLLRHEAGHAINYAYKLYRKKHWKDMFGEFKTEYGDIYRFRPYSKNYVRHLEDYYAQYHPDEDFAETFAVWLTPDSDWSNHYKEWNALKKLEFVDTLMKDISGKEPIVTTDKEYWNVSKIKRTLKSHYKNKQHFYAEDFPDFHDENLKKIFASKNDQTEKLPLASKLLSKYRRELLRNLKKWTGEKKYIANNLLNKIILRCRELNLVCPDSEQITLLKITTYISTLLMNYLHTGRFRGKK